MTLFDYPDPLEPNDHPLPDWSDIALADLLIEWMREQQ